MDLNETWQVGLGPEKTKPCTSTAKSRYGFRREREKMCRRGVFCDGNDAPLLPLSLDRFLPNFPRSGTNTCPSGGSRHMVSHSRKVSIKGSNFPKNRLLGYFTVHYLWPGYESRETFCGSYTVSIPWWTSHRYATPWWLLLRDVPFSSYPRPNVFLCYGISNG